MNWYVENSEFQKELEDLLNRHCKENGSNTPDFILSEYLMECLRNFDRCVSRRTNWYGDSIEVKVSAEEYDESFDPPYINCNDEKITLNKQWGN